MSGPRARSKTREAIAQALNHVAGELDEQFTEIHEIKAAVSRVEHALEQVAAILIELRGDLRHDREVTTEAIDALGIRIQRVERRSVV